MNNNIEINKFCDHFDLIFDQFFEIYVNWRQADIPKKTIIRTLLFFIVDLVYGEYGRGRAFLIFNKMIEDFEETNDLPARNFYN